MTSETLIETAAAKATKLLAAANPVTPVEAPPTSAAPAKREPQPKQEKNAAPDPVAAKDSKKPAGAQPTAAKAVVSPPPPKQAKGSRRRKNDRRQQDRPRQNAAVRNVIRRFAACDRCSYFMAGYRSIHGQENLETAIKQMDDNILNLTWSGRTSKLVHECYGVRVDLDYFHYEGCCVSCQRHFVYWQESSDEEETRERFRITL